MYSTSDAARILGLKTRFVYDLLRANWLEEGFGDFAGHKTLDFLTLIELQVIAQLRDAGIATSRIMRARRDLRLLKGAPHPFAQRDILETLRYGEGRVYWEFEGGVIELNGARQFAIKEFLSFKAHISFNPAGDAAVYSPPETEGAVELDPERQFGAPVLRGTNLRVSTLCDDLESGETPESLASIYEVEVEDVRNALNWCMAA